MVGMNARLLAAALLAATALAGPVACNKAGTEAQQAQAGTELGINLAALDKSVKPGDDFYAFANGGWMKSTEIPADRASVGGFYTAFLETEKHNRELIDGILKAKPDAGTDAGRIANFYSAYLNQAAIDKAGLAPIKPDLDRYAAIADKAALSRALGGNLRADVDPLNNTNYTTENLFGVFVTQGLATPGETLPYLLQGGLGLPEREYYLSSDPKMKDIQGKYRTYIAELFTAAGIPDGAAKAARVFDLETKMARAHATREESEDFAKAATVWSRADFDGKAPGIDWNQFFTAAQLGNQGKFNAYHAGAIRGLSALVASEPLDAWKDWLVFHQINKYADVLSSKIDATHFAFNGKTLNGTQQLLSRDRRAIAAVNTYLGDAVGKAYVEKHFPASAKAEVQKMVDNIKAAFGERVQAIDWMAPETKKEALAKVASIKVGVGYPDTWRNYGQLRIVGDNPYANIQAAERAEYAHQLAKIGKPMDKSEWWMTPQLVNAVNLPVQNALNFPAAILQRPFFDPKADPAFNYGAIGAVIGHEISHSFDNNGAKFDSTGLLRNWWTPADLKRFGQQGDALAAQYDQYAPFPDLKVNGKLTLGENIADVAGLAAAYDGYRKSLGGKAAPVIEGYNGDQRFFIAYGQAWATKMREEALRARIATDGHAPGQYRALTVRNIDAWYDAFGVKPGDKLYLPPEKRVKIW
jgi:predicted metalloendopeptidase